MRNMNGYFLLWNCVEISPIRILWKLWGKNNNWILLLIYLHIFVSLELFGYAFQRSTQISCAEWCLDIYSLQKGSWHVFLKFEYFSVFPPGNVQFLACTHTWHFVKHRTMRAVLMRGRRMPSASNWENKSNFPTQEFFESKPQLLKTFFHIKGVN